MLHEVISLWEPKLSDLVSSLIPKKTGKKPGSQRYRPGREAQDQSVEQLEAFDTAHMASDTSYMAS